MSNTNSENEKPEDTIFENTIFKDRKSKHPGRKKITIISQTANEIIADVAMADEVEEGGEGTAFTANLLNSWRQNIIKSKSDAEQANTTSEEAKDIAGQAVATAEQAMETAGVAETTANSADEKSNEAIATANYAKTTAEDALTRVVEKQGTVVTENGSLVPTFNADQKVNVSDYNTAQEVLNQRVGALERSALMTKVSYDAETDTFSI